MNRVYLEVVSKKPDWTDFVWLLILLSPILSVWLGLAIRLFRWIAGL